MKSLPRLFSIFFCFTVIFSSGCATLHAVDEHVNFDVADKITVYRDQWVQRPAPEVYVRPAEKAGFAPRVLIVPFRVTQQMENPDILGYTVARVIWQTWLSMEIYPAMEFSTDSVPFRRDRAMQLGRHRNVDVVIGGFVTHVYSGGTVGDSQLAVQIEAYDTSSGQMIWSIGHSGFMPGPRVNDYFIFATKTRQPTNPIQAIARVIGIDTGKLMQDWISEPPLQDRTKALDESLRDTLFREKDPTPAPRPYQPEEHQGQPAF